MSRLHVFWLTYLTFVSKSNASISQFLHWDNSPKCCNEGEIIWSNQTNYTCIPNINKSSYILTNKILPTFPLNSSQTVEACIDEMFNEESDSTATVKIDLKLFRNMYLTPSYFSKCCPINSAYDTYDHKCVTIANDTNNDFLSFTDEFLTAHTKQGLFYIKPGLTNCDSVIADYELDYFDGTVFRANNDIYLATLDKTISYGSYCVDKVYNSDKYVARVCHHDLNICKTRTDDSKGIRCIRKCCPDGKMYKGASQCKYDFENGLSFDNDSKVINLNEPFAIIPGIPCRKYLVEKSWDYTLNEMGSIKLNLAEDKSSFSSLDQHNTYCYERVDFGVIHDRRLFLCFKSRDKERIEFQITRIALLFSAIFLTLTLVGYILLPEMQNLHGKTLMCHCVSLLIAFIVLASLQFHPVIIESYCRLIGYIVMYLFLAAFMWSNIMCFDIWWTFGSMRVQGINQRRKELRQFLFYCLYAWSVPLVITLAAFCMQNFKTDIPESFHPIVPDLGYYNCFFEQRTNVVAFLVWFALPILVIIICNFVLYIKTIFYCYKVKSEIEKMKDSQSTKNERKKVLSADTERMKMSLKLFLVMGIPWMFETISLCAIPIPARGTAQIVQIFFDTLNCLQGFYLFCVYILRTRNIHAWIKK